MPKRSSYAPGTACWVDVMTPDVAGVTAFYTDLFGWDVEQMRDEGGGHIYSMFGKDGENVAGLGGLPPGMQDLPTAWFTYISVADAAATVAAIEKAGGQVQMPATPVFGWEYAGMDTGAGEEYWVAQGGESGGLAGLMARPAGMPDGAPDSWFVYFMVEDADATLQRAARTGGQTLFGPEAVPGVGIIATVGHPVGGVFALMQPGG